MSPQFVIVYLASVALLNLILMGTAGWEAKRGNLLSFIRLYLFANTVALVVAILHLWRTQ